MLRTGEVTQPDPASDVMRICVTGRPRPRMRPVGLIRATPQSPRDTAAEAARALHVDPRTRGLGWAQAIRDNGVRFTSMQRVRALSPTG